MILVCLCEVLYIVARKGMGDTSLPVCWALQISRPIHLATCSVPDHPIAVDYVVAIAYVMIYLEVGWLIFVLLRMYSRD